VSGAFQKTFARWVEAGRTVGFFLLLVLGSAACGLAVAWPLWLFATTQRRGFTITVVVVAAAGLLTAVVRAILRRRRSRREAGSPLAAFLSVLLTVMLVVIVPSGAYVAAAMIFRGFPVAFTVIAIAAWVGLLWLLGRLRRRTKTRKKGAEPAENGSE
jgi:hypothetical protein